jgi:hypothetical protein
MGSTNTSTMPAPKATSHNAATTAATGAPDAD